VSGNRFAIQTENLGVAVEGAKHDCHALILCQMSSRLVPASGDV